MFTQTLKTEIKTIAQQYDLEPETLMAVIEVESNGRVGAKVDGRLEPLIRFEGHYFYRLLPTRKRHEAITKGLANAVLGKVKNPFRQSSRWKLLKKAQAIDHDAALSSTSWGIGQVMGSHWRWLGYGSVDALVSAARSGPAGQIELMMRYVDKAGLIGKLKRYDWAGFARGYNGPSYRKNKYDRKLHKAYLQHKGLRRFYAPANTLASLRLGSFGQAVRDLQKDLSQLGYTLRIDGDFGFGTENAVKNFQRSNRIKIDGIVGPKVFELVRRKLF